MSARLVWVSHGLKPTPHRALVLCVLLLLMVWGGFVQIVLKDDLRWKTWSGPDTPVS